MEDMLKSMEELEELKLLKLEEKKQNWFMLSSTFNKLMENDLYKKLFVKSNNKESYTCQRNFKGYIKYNNTIKPLTISIYVYDAYYVNKEGKEKTFIEENQIISMNDEPFDFKI
jgi:hypothetical protein